MNEDLPPQERQRRQALWDRGRRRNFVQIDLAVRDECEDWDTAALLSRIAYRCEKRGHWRATQEQVSADCRISGRTLRRKQQWLIDHNWITVEASGGYDRTSVYRVVDLGMPDMDENEAPDVATSIPPDWPDPSGQVGHIETANTAGSRRPVRPDVPYREVEEELQEEGAVPRRARESTPQQMSQPVVNGTSDANVTAPTPILPTVIASALPPTTGSTAKAAWATALATAMSLSPTLGPRDHLMAHLLRSKARKATVDPDRWLGYFIEDNAKTVRTESAKDDEFARAQAAHLRDHLDALEEQRVLAAEDALAQQQGAPT